MIILICAITTSCVNSNLVEKLSVIDYNSKHKDTLTLRTDFSRVKDIDQEINDIVNRGSEVRYEVLGVSIDEAKSNTFKVKRVNTKIKALKNYLLKYMNQ